uniref:Major facilitator superfamily (MFS) profile domain-containing protein n=1 Tax=Oryza rufipogon TaxID=4529 RepID=A0A0E0P9Z9_ORYRU
MGAVNLGSTLVSIATVDRYGRRVAVAWIMGSQIGRDGESAMARRYSVAVLALTCVFSAAFGWSWGPLTWGYKLLVTQGRRGEREEIDKGATGRLGRRQRLLELCNFPIVSGLGGVTGIKACRSDGHMVGPSSHRTGSLANGMKRRLYGIPNPSPSTPLPLAMFRDPGNL